MVIFFVVGLDNYALRTLRVSELGHAIDPTPFHSILLQHLVANFVTLFLEPQITVYLKGHCIIYKCILFRSD